MKMEDWNVLAPQCFDRKRKDRKSMRNTSNKRRRISFFTCNHTLISYFTTTLYSSFLPLSSNFPEIISILDKICQKPHVILHTLNVRNWYWPSIISTNCKLSIQHICFIQWNLYKLIMLEIYQNYFFLIYRNINLLNQKLNLRL